MGKNTRKRSASVANVDSNPSTEEKANKKPSASKAGKKARVPKQSNPITAWDAVSTKYPTEINAFYPSQASVPESLSIVKFLATLPAVHGALDDRNRRIGTNPFSLALGSRGSTMSHEKYEHFHARNQSSRAQGNIKAVLAQASGTPARIPCSRCSENRTLWEACMKAPTVPGLDKEDALNGACPGCYYNGTGNTCSNRPPITKKAKSQPAEPSVAEAESSTQASSRPHTTTKSASAASSTSDKKTNPKPAKAAQQSANTLEKESGTGILDANKMQQLLAENETLRQENEKLQARVYELEDIIEGEEQQCMI